MFSWQDWGIKVLLRRDFGITPKKIGKSGIQAYGENWKIAII